MKQIIHFFTFTLFLAIASNQSFARKPAVEPVSGISIDQYDDVPPAKANPYDFNQGKTKELAPAKRSKAVKKTTLDDMKSSKKSRTNQVIVLLMVFLLPVAVWLGLMKGIKDLDNERPNNIVDLDAKRTSDDDDDIDFPKAS